ncbi:MAG TPA: VIT1/CCC1 transporter family protein, partial [Methylomirabilota bacterium]
IGRATTALAVSSAVTMVALLLFGYVKGRFTGAPPVRSALQTAFIGGIAAAVAFAVASAITM